MVRKAIVLAAGKGMRLEHHTAYKPKCMVSVCGKPILARLLESLDNLGLGEVVIVTGYNEHVIKDTIGESFGNMKIAYVTNEKYSETNNIYSLWLAISHLKEDALIFAGDILVKKNIISDVLEEQKPDSGIVSRFRQDLNGTCATLDGNFIKEIFLKKDQPENFDFSDKYKTVNIFKLSKDFLVNAFIPSLSDFIRKGEVHDFYEIVLRDLLRAKKTRIHAHVIGGEDWYEVDTPEELKMAEEIVKKW